MDPSKHTDGDPSEAPRPALPDGGGPAGYPGEASSSSSSPRPPPQQQQRDVTDSQRHMRADAPLPSVAPSPSMASSSDAQQQPALGPPYPSVPDPRVVHYVEMTCGGSSSTRQQQLWPIALAPPLQQSGPQFLPQPPQSGSLFWPPVLPSDEAFGTTIAHAYAYAVPDPVCEAEADDLLRQVADFAVDARAGGQAEPPQPVPDVPDPDVAAGAELRAKLIEFCLRPRYEGSGRTISTPPAPASELNPNACEFESIRSRLLSDPGYLGPAMSPRSSMRVACLLKTGEAKARTIVLAGVKAETRRFMENQRGSEIFGALIGLAELTHADLMDIVNSAFEPAPKEEAPEEFDTWVISMRMLITKVWQADSADLRARIIDYLKGLMDSAGGDILLEHCFATMSYEETRALIRHALHTLDNKLETEFRSRCMSVCFRWAQGDELDEFEKFVREGAREMAMGKYSNNFIQVVLEYGLPGMQQVVVDELKKDVASLCRDEYGHCVVQSCFTKTGESRAELLRRLLQEFCRLSKGQLRELATDSFANGVLCGLLDTARALLPPDDRRTLALARQIRTVLKGLPENSGTWRLMLCTEELLSTTAVRDRRSTEDHAVQGTTATDENLQGAAAEAGLHQLKSERPE